MGFIGNMIDRFRGPREDMTVTGNGMAAEPTGLAPVQPIGHEQVMKAATILNKYKQKKASLETRVKENEDWYKNRTSARVPRDSRSGEINPKSAWLFNSLANKHADAMDNFPRPNILPREEGDEPEAKILSSIIPVILDQADFEETFSDEQMFKLKSGTGVYSCTWDAKKLNGLGDIAIRKCDILNLFWDPGVTDIQESPNLFYVSYADNEAIVAQYPQLAGHTGTGNFSIPQYSGDNQIDTSDKTIVVDWYYKRNVNGRDVLQYCKYANGVVLYATENDPQMRERGLYDHGMYPFVIDTLYKIEGSPAGFGFIDEAKDTQEYIDHLDQAILSNALAGARPRYFNRIGGGIKEEEFTDFTKTVVHVEGNLDDNNIRPVDVYPLNGIYVTVAENKINELKEVTGNRDVMNGGTTGGVTAASGVAAMQEAGAKLTRDMSKSTYRAFRRLVAMVIELIRQFYDTERTFRIIGEQGAAEYIQYSNAGIAPQLVGYDTEGNPLMRVPLFDVEITAEKASPYSRMAQNELALDFYGRGFFAPQNADQATMCLDMMDFDGKDELIQKIKAQGGMFQQMQMLAAMLDRALGTNEYSASLAQQYGLALPQGASEAPALSGNRGGESATTAKARARTAAMTEV